VFEGANWISYNMMTYPGMVSNNIKVVTAMNNGDIWIGTDYGASKFNGVNWVTFNDTNGLNNNQVYSIDEDNLGRVWIEYGLEHMREFHIIMDLLGVLMEILIYIGVE
jgi:ligand-binding sensor domain-containing protein